MPPYIAPYTLCMLCEDFALLSVYCSVDCSMDCSVTSVIKLHFLLESCSVLSPWNSVYICLYVVCDYSVIAP